ncbi:MAG: monovalent cation/H+ antiporter complex subunit F [Candidatus Flexifilum sp.]
MSELVSTVAQIALIILIILLLPCAYRVFKGPRPAERLQALDLMTTLLIGIVILLAVVQRSDFVVDIALALAAFGFVSTLAIARYIASGKVF